MAKQKKKAPRAVPAGSPKVEQIVTKIPVIVPKPIFLKTRAKTKAKPAFMGYRREDGRIGIRNHIIILPLDDLSNAASEAVAHNIKGTLAIPHPYGRLQFGEDRR